jgi:hypothetical protein
MTESNTVPEPDASWTNQDFLDAAEVFMAAENDGSPTEGAHDDRDGRTASRREATYRIRAREAEAAATALEERVTRMQRAEVERQAAAQLHNAADLWQQVELVELLDADGEVDPQRVAKAVAALGDSRPYMVKPPRGVNFGQGRRTLVDDGSGTSWGSVLRGG